MSSLRQFCTTTVLTLGVFLFMAEMTPATAQVKEVPTRDQIEDKYKWKLEDLYPSDDAWEKAVAAMKEAIPSFENYRGKLGNSAEMLLECLQLNDSLSSLLHRQIVYAFLKKDEDNRVGKYQEMGDRISTVRAQFNQASSYIEPEILTIPDEKLRSFLEQNPKLATYKFYIEDMLRRKAHILSPEMENLLAMSGNVTRGFSQIFTMIDDADIKYGTITDENGNQVELTKERYSALLESTDRRVRKEASDTYNNAYFAYENTLGATLSGSVNSDIYYTKARKYKTCLERSLDEFNIPLDVFHNLIKSVNENLAPLHRYTALRKKVLKLDTLYTYDMWVPLVPEAKMEFPDFEEAKKVLFDGLKPLGNEYLNNLKMALDSRWVDVFETQGKGSGAYSWGTYSVHPYILMNYAGTLDNVFTLAHELGHAMHSYYTNKNEPYIYAGHSLFTAEVASTCNEAIMIKYMIEHAQTREQKLYLLNYYINQILGTFYSQVMFSEFELKIHETVEQGGALSAESMRKMYREIYQKYYGPDLVIEPSKDLGGLRISHFYRQYYVYQYATSYAASQMLSRRILSGDKTAVEDYLNFIKIGSSDYPINILKRVGIDMTRPEAVQNVTQTFAELVEQFEKLILEN